MLNCPACHSTECIEVPGVTRWAEVFACKECGTLRLRVKDVKTIHESEKTKGGDT